MQKLVYRVVAISATAFVVASPFLGLSPFWKQAVLMFWTIAPPLWFYAEWEVVANKGADVQNFGEWFERFKYSQELASKFWVAVATVLFALFFGEKFFHP